ncbi:hypothetical protein CPC08DRAFT_817985 [Agrocybe pediades]|nr:hypothetical protein CPC08DRAFT_817985 [Agrocybe pediades]
MFASQPFKEHGRQPITRLHEEILYMIFLENSTDLDDGFRLIHARSTSQVCQQWRRLLLNSPSIWARLIDLDDLREARPAWVQEVMTRSQNCPLWITGPVHVYRPSPFRKNFFLNLISEHWDRIEILHVSDDWDDSSKNLSVDGQDQAGHWQRLFNRPAPLLKEFAFRYTKRAGLTRRVVQALSPSPLLNGNAPALRMFGIHRNGSASRRPDRFIMDMPSSWLSKLRSFTLQQDLDLTQLLGLLRLTPLLEKLKVTRFAASATDSLQWQESPVSLPRLSSLRLEDWETADVVMFLESISPSAGCCVDIFKPPKSNNPLPLHQEVITRAQHLFMCYIQEYFENRPVKNLFLSYDDQYLEVFEMPSYALRPYSPSFSLSIPNGSEDNSWILQSLFTSRTFANVMAIDLRDWEKGMPYAPSAFSSAKTIDLRIADLEPLSKYLEEANDPLLPELRSLKLHGLELGSEYGVALHNILEQRRQISRQISVLDLSQIGGISCNLDALDEFVGLSVVLPLSMSESEECYVCGTGHPELLRFGDPRCYEPVQPRLRRIPRPFARNSTYGWSCHI